MKKTYTSPDTLVVALATSRHLLLYSVQEYSRNENSTSTVGDMDEE